MQALGSVRRQEEVMKNLFQSSDNLKKKIASLKDHYEWEKKETQELACYLLERFPALLAMDDATRKLDEMMKQKGRKVVDKETLCRFMEECFLTTTLATFKNLLTKYVQQFKEEKALRRDYYKPEAESLKNFHVFGMVKGKILFVREYFDWENEETQELACYLLERFPSLLLTGDLIKIIEGKMEEENQDTVDEALFFQGMEETFLVTATVTFDNFIKGYAQQIK
jgi:hypothetical protein